MPSRKLANAQPGFSLVELLVVISIVSVLVALLLPAVQASREASRKISCASRIRQLALGMHSFHSTHNNFPVGSLGTRYFQPHDRRQISWIAHILPFVEEMQVWNQFDLDQAYDSAANGRAAGSILPILLCPTSAGTEARTQATTGDRNNNGAWDPGDNLALTDYGGMFGAGLPNQYEFMNGVLVYEQAISDRHITDGLSQTILIGEDAGRPVTAQTEWANGQNIFDQTGPINRTRNNELWSDHPGGVHVALCDGAVAWLNETMDLSVLLAMCTRDNSDISNR